METLLSNKLPKQLYTARETREIDRRVINQGPVTGYELMCKAGQFAFDCLTEAYPNAHTITIFCGSGNNGGDGYVIGALAAQKGANVSICSLGEPGTDDARCAFDFAKQQGCDIQNGFSEQALNRLLDDTDLVVDAMLGTGVDRDISGKMAVLIEKINESSVAVVSCDIPTGLHSDTGRIMGCCINASLTVTFIALKAGLFTGEGRSQTGKVKFSNLDADESAYIENSACARLLCQDELKSVIKPRRESAHKGLTGYAGIIGGAPGMMGAVLMAAKAAYRIGCGRVQVLSHEQHCSQLALNCPELLSCECDENSVINENLKAFNALAIGPGLGLANWGKSLFSQALQSNSPIVVDADALSILAKEKHRRDNWVLTPHPGEAARLLGCTSSDIQHDRFASIQEIINQYGGVCVLKGSGSLIGCADRTIRVCAAGNSGQASAGMGDVLTGCIVGLIAQGYDVFEAAILATWFHASAADRVAEDSGKLGIMATDLLMPMKQLHNHLQ